MSRIVTEPMSLLSSPRYVQVPVISIATELYLRTTGCTRFLRHGHNDWTNSPKSGITPGRCHMPRTRLTCRSTITHRDSEGGAAMRTHSWG
jgi:hypothetical protein